MGRGPPLKEEAAAHEGGAAWERPAMTIKL